MRRLHAAQLFSEVMMLLAACSALFLALLPRLECMALAWCMPNCRCMEKPDNQNRHLRVADCSNRHLINIDEDWLGGEIFVQGLDLSGNSLTEMRADFPGNVEGRHHLLALSLADNRIAVIASDALRGLTALKAFDLSNNRLGLLPAQLFADTPSLRMLDLSGNKLEPQPGGWFIDAPRLTHLSLARCNFGHMTKQAFTRVPLLQTLDLSGNELINLEAPTVFRSLLFLRHLELADNPLTCDASLQQWLLEHNVEQYSPICVTSDDSHIEKSQAMKVMDSPRIAPVFAGLACESAASTFIDETSNSSSSKGSHKNEWEEMLDDEQNNSRNATVAVVPVDIPGFKLNWYNRRKMLVSFAIGLVLGIAISVCTCLFTKRYCCRCGNNLDRDRVQFADSTTSLLYDSQASFYRPSGADLPNEPGPPPYRER